MTHGIDMKGCGTKEGLPRLLLHKWRGKLPLMPASPPNNNMRPKHKYELKKLKHSYLRMETFCGVHMLFSDCLK